jgi:hypothetical protein
MEVPCSEQRPQRVIVELEDLSLLFYDFCAERTKANWHAPLSWPWTTIQSTIGLFVVSRFHQVIISQRAGSVNLMAKRTQTRHFHGRRAQRKRNSKTNNTQCGHSYRFTHPRNAWRQHVYRSQTSYVLDNHHKIC